MPQRARIRLSSTDQKALENICAQVRAITQRTGVNIAGPIPLPTKRLKVPVRKTPCGQGSHTWETWEMRIHKRLIDVDSDERTMRQIMRIRVPNNVYIEIEII